MLLRRVSCPFARIKISLHILARSYLEIVLRSPDFRDESKTAPCSGTSPEQGAFLCNYPVVLFLNSSVPSVRAFPFWRILMMEIVLSHAVTSPAFREETLFLPFHPVPPQPLHKLLRQRRGERHPFPRPWVRERKRVRVEHQAGDFRASS